MLDNSILMICPTEEKLNILEKLNKENALHNIKFMTKQEFIGNYYFSYNEKAYFYLLKKYHYHIDVAKVYLESLYPIDENKNYQNEKLKFLKELKLELKREGLLEENPNFKKYLQGKKIIVKNYYDLEKYEEEVLKPTHSFKNKKIHAKVVEYNTLEEEVNGVCLKIINLLKKGVNINKISLTNISDDYLYALKKIFSFYHIPLNLNLKNSIYSTKVVRDYLKTKTLDLEDPKKITINKKIISTLSSLSFLDDASEEYQIMLMDKLKKQSIPPKKLQNAINIKDLYKESFADDEYVFVLGFNQDILPKMEKDISYITDSIKSEVKLYTTSEKNKRNKLAIQEILSSIKNLFLSYKLSSPFNSFYRSSLIADMNLEVIRENEDTYENSNLYNQLRLAEKLDLYHLYGEKDSFLNILYTHYQIPYKTYSNKFTGIDQNKYLEVLPYPLKLSYTTMNYYNECKFKYYIKQVLKLDPYEDSFSSFIGSMYHKILSLYQKTNFNLEIEYQKYISNHDLTLKEKMLLIRIKRDLIELLTVLKKQQLLTGYDNAYLEKKVEIPLKKKVEVVFTGYIDKIMYYQKIEDTYFSIIDYKTGTIDTHIEPMKYGLHMQLPVYLYLIHYSKTFSNPIFTGIYYQNILFNYPTWTGKEQELQKEEKMLLQGYSTEDTEILERFDSTFEKSEYIKSMSYTEEKGFGPHAKIISNDTLYELIKYTKNYIDKIADKMIEADFEINPKVYAGKNVACEFCNFKDLCYRKESDLVYLDKVEDLTFLGGEE